MWTIAWELWLLLEDSFCECQQGRHFRHILNFCRDGPEKFTVLDSLDDKSRTELRTLAALCLYEWAKSREASCFHL
eukprot:5664547-Amphidinium_carterae.1